ncbi:heparan-alpha-glucosaminide N-acetyltransferase-like protein [Actinidia rufa]|uniref:Heparan-alpha-glucosaminide N-acetyltransferase-like protein n=1 Tax=Actinidia rufa TaxID=165716 RepID=A0A7J0DKR5_9ERIC|nr:heparan-alpha-glucosaminide N-acetyltransferase-like protein [Actinidia rufa]
MADPKRVEEGLIGHTQVGNEEFNMDGHDHHKKEEARIYDDAVVLDPTDLHDKEKSSHHIHDEQNQPLPPIKPKTKRVATLDAFRGLTIVASVAIALALKPNAMKLDFDVAENTQGGYSHAPNDLSYGVDMKKIRWCGILQRPSPPSSDQLSSTWSFLHFHTAYRWQWLGGFVSFIIYMVTTYALYVPDWSFTVHDDQEPQRYTVKCGMRGHLGPACNAVGYVDRQVWGINHLYSQPVWKRLNACTLSSPSDGPLRENAPSWCRAPFEPEGLLSTISAILSGTIGIHYGHVLIHFKGHSERLKQWVSMGLGLLILSIILHFTDAIPINKQLYSFSYVCFTAGAAGNRVLWVLHAGKNAMLVFVMAAEGIFAAFINGWYYETPDNSLVHWIRRHVFVDVWNSERVGTLLYVIFAEITFWGVVSGILHKFGIYWKL